MTFNCKKSFFTILLGFMLLCFFSCKTTQQISQTTQESAEWPSDLQFSYFSAKISVEYDNYSLQGQLRMKNDSILWISLNKFGLELARVKATTDSVFFLNKFEGECKKGTYRDLSKLIGFDLNFNMLQSILLGNDFSCFETDNAKKQQTNNLIAFQFNNRKTSKNCPFSFKNSFHQIFLVDVQNNKIVENHLKLDGKSEELHAKYSKFLSKNEQQIPSQVQITAGTNDVNFSLSAEYSNITLDIPLTFPFSVPAKYKINNF